MKNSIRNKIDKYSVNISRFVLSFTFILSGFAKAVDPVGVQYKIQEYFAVFGVTNIHSFVSLFLAVGISALELTIGLLLFWGIRRNISTLLSMVIMLVMTPLTLYLYITNNIVDCGCFGEAFKLTNGETLSKNIILLIASIANFIYRKRIFRFITFKTEWVISLYTILFSLFFPIYSVNTMPIIDFRPYKIGNNIKQEMYIQPGAKPYIYENSFILTRDGEQREFTLENYPDSTWTFVETRTKVIQVGEEPNIKDFSITDIQSGEDITDSILSEKEYTFLLISNKLETADDSKIDVINEIYDYARKYGYKFYCLTSSNSDAIIEWTDKTGAEYSFLMADDTVLKTIVRSNPGLMLIKEGTIMNKWSMNTLPKEDELTNSLEKIKVGYKAPQDITKILLTIILIYFLPTLLVMAIDITVVFRREKNKKKNNIQTNTEITDNK